MTGQKKIRGHQHFCAGCYGHSGKNRSGWWRCTDKKCTRANEYPCKQHQPRVTR